MLPAAVRQPVSRSPSPQLAAALRCTHCNESGTTRLVGTRLARCAACDFVLPIPRPGARGPQLVFASLESPLGPGTVLRGRYRLVEVLGRGEHGVTYLAQHEFLNHPCVVKVLPERAETPSQEAARRLRNEASAGFRVNHPNVVRVLDADEFQGIWYFVMEYIDGVDLAVVAAEAGPIDWRQALHLALDAARGLDAIHRAGLVHQDIKPGNLILGADGSVRIADLGVARLMRGHAAGGPAEPARGAGSLAYAAPEALEGGAGVGPEADLYSLGAALFELVTGSLPRGPSLYRTWLAADGGTVAWPEHCPGEVPAWFRDAILRLLRRDPAQRFGSAQELTGFLERLTGRPASTSRAVLADYPQPRGVVVLPFSSAAGEEADAWIGHAVADHLAQSLAQLPGLYVADLGQFLQTLERLAERDVQPRARRLREAARLAGAATVVEGVFERSGKTIRLAARVHQTGRDAPAEVGTVDGALAALADLEAELLDRVVRTLGLTVGRQPLRPSAAGRETPAAAERFFTAKRAFLRGDYDTALRVGNEALALDGHYGDALGLVAACCTRMGRYAEAVEYNRRQRELAGRAGDERLNVQAHANSGAMHYFRGEYEPAEEYLTRAAQLAEPLGLSTELAHIRNNLGFVLLALGRQREAEETFLRAIETLKTYGALVALIGPYNGMGHVLREEKRFEEARGYFLRALALAQEAEDRVNMGIAYMNLGRCALLQGRLSDAKHELAVALNILEQTSFWNGLARVYEYMAELNLRLANWTEAGRCAQMRLELARRHANARMEEAARQQLAEARRQAAALEPQAGAGQRFEAGYATLASGGASAAHELPEAT